MLTRRILSHCGLLLLLVTSACSSGAPAPTAAAAPTKAIQPSATPSATITPTPAPSATPTITPTAQPEKPEGAQAFDEGRDLWSKTEGGQTLYYFPDVKAWATALNQNPIYLVNSTNYATNLGTVLPPDFKSMQLHYYRVTGAERPFLTIEVPNAYDAGAFGGPLVFKADASHSIQDWVAILLAQRLNSKPLANVTPAMLVDVLQKLGTDSLVLAQDIPSVAKDNSQVTTKYWNPIHGIDLVEVPWTGTENDPSYYGRLSATMHWKLGVRGGDDAEHPGKLVVIFATNYTMRFNRDRREANMLVIGPLFPALLSQKGPLLDFVSVDPVDLGNFSQERVMLHTSKGTSLAELDGPFDSAEFAAFVASVSGANPFFVYQCVHLAKNGTEETIDCYQ